MSDTPVLLVSGPVGVGKTTVGGELSELLEREHIAHTFIDFDGLRWTYPRPAGDRWGDRLAFQNLRDVWANCAAAGAKNLVLASVVENRAFLRDVESAVGSARIRVCQLRAPVATLEARVRRRELGSALDWHVARAAELAAILSDPSVPCDFTVETGNRELRAISEALFRAVDWAR